ncbi:hypothetical protein QN277_019113 [Acacia crassicarpa]|uniref:Uncharacterized protein n=1 Tax=Acacia crassicarpa TaxID=499986 RepID=A0AAE1KIM1_9FABA|nr:hypothetical protein QN277_019113 [Acacia crassicarpa]
MLSSAAARKWRSKEISLGLKFVSYLFEFFIWFFVPQVTGCWESSAH